MNKTPLSIEAVALLCGSNVITISSLYLRGELTGWCKVPGGFVSADYAAQHIDPEANARAVTAERDAFDRFTADAIKRGESSDAASRKAAHDAAVEANRPYAEKVERERKALEANVVAGSDVRRA